MLSLNGSTRAIDRDSRVPLCYLQDPATTSQPEAVFRTTRHPVVGKTVGAEDVETTLHPDVPGAEVNVKRLIKKQACLLTALIST